MNNQSDHCILCNSEKVRLLSRVKDVEYFTSDLEYEYWICDWCESIYLKNPPIERLAEIYPDNYYSVAGPDLKRLSLYKILESVKKYFDKNLLRSVLKKVNSDSIECLDIGGGAGWMSSLIRQSDVRVSGTTIIDINNKSRTIAERNGHKFILGTIESLEHRERYDFILMLNLIEHVADPLKVLRSIFDSMNKNGLLLVKTPNTRSLNRLIFGQFYWGGFHAPRHWVLFNRDSFTDLATKSGFVVDSFRYTQGAPQWAASIVGSFKHRFLGGKKTPIYSHSVTTLLLLFFSIFDLIRMPFSPTDQMIFVLRKP